MQLKWESEFVSKRMLYWKPMLLLVGCVFVLFFFFTKLQQAMPCKPDSFHSYLLQWELLFLLCVCDSHTQKSSYPRRADHSQWFWVLAVRTGDWEPFYRSGYTGTAVLTVLQLVLPRKGICRLLEKEISDDVVLLLPWTDCGFSCLRSRKGKFIH